MRRFVIVGAGLAGHRAALELRAVAPQASILLIGNEERMPYDRPPLSKEILLGTAAPASTALKDADRYGETNISFLPSTTIVAVDRIGKAVVSHTGERFPYDRLLLATGSRPRRLDYDAGSPTVHYLRTLDDALRLREGLQRARDIAVVGGGFIGLEVASAARRLGLEVTVIEAQDRLLARGVPSTLSAWMDRLHAHHGTRILLRQSVSSIEPRPRGGLRLRLANQEIDADLAVIGVGIHPNVELAEACGLETGDGIVVDAQCRTSDPDIFAAGEVTRHPLAIDGSFARIESWQTASLQPAVAARSMADIDASYASVPWLWSDQFEHNIQVIGLPELSSRRFVRGDLASDRWTLVSVDAGGRPLGAVAVNNGRDISMIRRALSREQSLFSEKGFSESFVPMDTDGRAPSGRDLSPPG